jgi:hypothetical protein
MDEPSNRELVEANYARMEQEIAAIRAERDRAFKARDNFMEGIESMRKERTQLQSEYGKVYDERDALKAELSTWMQAVGLATTCAPDMLIDTTNPIGMMQEVCRRFADLLYQLHLLIQEKQRNYMHYTLKVAHYDDTIAELMSVRSSVHDQLDRICAHINSQCENGCGTKVRELLLSTRTTPAWGDKKPTVPGWYWCHGGEGAEPRIWYIDHDDIHRGNFSGGQLFYGPLTPPQEGGAHDRG